jgi:hypothetical protein
MTASAPAVKHVAFCVYTMDLSGGGQKEIANERKSRDGAGTTERIHFLTKPEQPTIAVIAFRTLERDLI